MKKIYIDGLGLVEGHFSGIGQYILGILRGLDDLLDDAKYANELTPEIVVIIPKDTEAKFRAFGFKHIGYKKFPLPFRYMAALWHRGWLPPIDVWCGIGTYIFPRFVDMRLLFSKSAALVIFDSSYLIHPEYADEGNLRFLTKFVRGSIKKTRKIITISQSARREILEYYDVPASKVSIAYPATDSRNFYRRSPSEIDFAKLRYEIAGNYILALSNLEPRKNLVTLVRSYCELPKQLRDKYALLLVGVSGWKTETLFNEIYDKVQAGFNIIRPVEYVSDADKPAIISGASLFVYPSHYEGFGMPPIEALACGVPVIAADNSSLPEAVGKAALLVDADNQEQLTKVMIETLENIEKISKDCLLNGPKQVERFSWKESARVFLKAASEIE